MGKWGFTRGLLLVALLVCGFSVAWLVGLGGVARADTVTCTTQGDVSCSVTWTQAAGANQTTLVVQNTATSGGHTISDFTFVIQLAGVQIQSVSTNSCTVQSSATIFCGSPIAPGATVTVTITTASPVATGTAGTFTPSDNLDVAQPAVDVVLQGPGGTTTGTTSTTASTTTSPTTTGATAPATCPGYPAYPEPPGCADLGIVRLQAGFVFNHGDDTSGVVLGVVITPDNAGFQPNTSSFWQDGETLHVHVSVTNNGPDPSGFVATLKSSVAGDKTVYEGKEEVVHSGAGGQSSLSFDRGRPVSIDSFLTAAVDFEVTVHGAGLHTFTASVHAVKPDPNPLNNTKKLTIDVQPRPNFTAHWDKATNSVVGTQTAPSARGTSSIAGPRSAGLRPVEVAILSSLAAKRVFHRATGTAHWSLRVPAGSKGQMTVLVCAVTPQEAARLEFSPGLHNLFRLRIG